MKKRIITKEFIKHRYKIIVDIPTEYIVSSDKESQTEASQEEDHGLHLWDPVKIASSDPSKKKSDQINVSRFSSQVKVYFSTQINTNFQAKSMFIFSMFLNIDKNIKKKLFVEKPVVLCKASYIL